jgi:hypothetical protein
MRVPNNSIGTIKTKDVNKTIKNRIINIYSLGEPDP